MAIPLAVAAPVAIAGAQMLYQEYKDAQRQGDRRKAERLRNELMQRTAELPEPVLADLALKDPEFAGAVGYVSSPGQVAYEGYDPTLAQFQELGRPKAADVRSDPRLRNEQLAALAALDEIAAGGGMTAQDRANMQRLQNQTAQSNKGRQDAILQNRASRGMAGSGDELLAQLASSQAATNQQSAQSLDISAMAQQRALEAILNKGQAAGNLRSQDVQEAARRAEAEDAIARFNAQNSLAANQWNAGTQNQAAGDLARGQFDASRTNIDTQKWQQGTNREIQGRNLDRTQSYNNNAAGNRNKETAWNTIDKSQREFDNARTKNNDYVNAATGRAGAYDNAANRSDARDDARFQGVMQGVTSYLDWDAKKNGGK